MSREELELEYIELVKKEYAELTKEKVSLWDKDLEEMMKILDRRIEIIKELSDLRA